MPAPATAVRVPPPARRCRLARANRRGWALRDRGCAGALAHRLTRVRTDGILQSSAPRVPVAAAAARPAFEWG